MYYSSNVRTYDSYGCCHGVNINGKIFNIVDNNGIRKPFPEHAFTPTTQVQHQEYGLPAPVRARFAHPYEILETTAVLEVFAIAPIWKRPHHYVGNPSFVYILTRGMIHISKKHS